MFFGVCWVWFCRGCAAESFLSSRGWLWNSCAGFSSTMRTARGSRQRSAATSTERTPSRRRTATRSSSVMLMSSAILCAGLCSLATQCSFFYLPFCAFIKTKKATFYKNHSSLSTENERHRKYALITLYCYVCVVAKKSPFQPHKKKLLCFGSS